MRNVALFACILALATFASAQQLIDFTRLSDTGTPLPVPNGYDHLSWSAIDYVDALTYGDANGSINTGRGFYSGPEVMVAFLGGPLCFPSYAGRGSKADGVPSKNICEGVISSGIGPTALNYFTVTSGNVSAGWLPGTVTFQAYKDGVQVGSDWQQTLTTKSQTVIFPNWGKISELVIHPGPGGSVVLYTLEMQ